MATYSIDTDSFAEAIAKLVRVFVAQNPSIGTSRFNIEVSAPSGNDTSVTVAIRTRAPKRRK